jgi:hypothetical protein
MQSAAQPRQRLNAGVHLSRKSGQIGLQTDLRSTGKSTFFAVEVESYTVMAVLLLGAIINI